MMQIEPQRHGDTEKPVYYEEGLTGKIIASAIEVHRHLGPGLLESAYEECFCHELYLRGIPFSNVECEMRIAELKCFPFDFPHSELRSPHLEYSRIKRRH